MYSNLFLYHLYFSAVMYSLPIDGILTLGYSSANYSSVRSSFRGNDEMCSLTAFQYAL